MAPARFRPSSKTVGLVEVRFFILLLLLIAGVRGGAPAHAEPPPVLYFKATGITDRILIEWETAYELNVEAFCVQRSLHGGSDFVRIADCLPAKGGIEGASYSLIDTDVVRGTVYYYRLEALDRDGGSHIIAITAVRATGLTCLCSSPSPLRLILSGRIAIA